jgi:hypothetical protein
MLFLGFCGCVFGKVLLPVLIILDIAFLSPPDLSGLRWQTIGSLERKSGLTHSWFPTHLISLWLPFSVIAMTNSLILSLYGNIGVILSFKY